MSTCLCYATDSRGIPPTCACWRITWVLLTLRGYSSPPKPMKTSLKEISLRWVRGWRMRWNSIYSHFARFSAFQRSHSSGTHSVDSSSEPHYHTLKPSSKISSSPTWVFRHLIWVTCTILVNYSMLVCGSWRSGGNPNVYSSSAWLIQRTSRKLHSSSYPKLQDYSISRT